MEKSAHTTLQLRAFYRQFRDRRVPDEYYEHLHGDLSLEKLYEAWPAEAKAAADEAWCAKLGQIDATEVHQRIEKALAGAKTWVLLGGPPCQAYSIAGRSRRSKDEDFEDDEKHTLYREYLRIIADHRPPVFVMENVKGLLSATLDGQSTFKRILEDLKHPCRALDVPTPDGDLEYRIYSLSKAVSSNGDLGAAPDFQPSDYVVACEDYGVPQARHRIILLGIRSDLKVAPKTLKSRAKPVKVSKVISDLPRIRSGLSDCVDDFQTWFETLKASLEGGPLADAAIDQQVRELMVRLMGKMRKKLSTGREFMRCSKSPKYARKWYADARLKGVCNHVARRHIRQDLFRYFFVSCYGRHQKTSPKLRHFPAALLPKHKNVDTAIKSSLFSDRFRVQLRNAPATTITSHIAKDGHYFIHPDPTQCRALTVREAARVQTFPDNYLFKGNRTQQYQQVGNAVPPFLARQIAGIVRDVLDQVALAAGDRLPTCGSEKRKNAKSVG